MSAIYDDILQGLNEAIAYERGEGSATVTRLTRRIEPPPVYTAEQVKRIRLDVNMTQRVFAEYMGVSVKTVEAWESGRNTPSGSSARLMQIITEHKNLVPAN